VSFSFFFYFSLSFSFLGPWLWSYRCLLPKETDLTDTEPREIVEQFFSETLDDDGKQMFRFGNTKVFMKDKLNRFYSTLDSFFLTFLSFSICSRIQLNLIKIEKILWRSQNECAGESGGSHSTSIPCISFPTPVPATQGCNFFSSSRN